MTQADAVAIDRLRAVACGTAINEVYRNQWRVSLSFRADLHSLLSLITAYESQAERLREVEGALEPFAALADFDAALTERWEGREAPPDGNAVVCWSGGFGLKAPVVTYGHFRRARAALTQSPPATDSTDV